MKLFVGCYGTGVMFSDMSKEEDGDYKHLAFVSDLGGKITWYVKKNSLPEDVIHDVEYQSKVSRDAFRRMIAKMPEDKAFFFLLDEMPDITSYYVMYVLEASKQAKIDYMCSVLEGKPERKIG